MPLKQIKRSSLPVHVVLLLTAMLLTAVARGQVTLHVGPGQIFTAVQSAIDAANPGDTVLVAPGTYYEQLTCAKAITIVSSAGPASTFIDGSRGNGFVVTIDTPLAPDNSPRAPAIFDGFTVQNGFITDPVFASDGGGITIGGTATVRNNTVLNNYPSGVTVRASNALVMNNHILQTASAMNATHPSTGIAVAANSVLPYAYLSSPPSLKVTGNLIENNYGAGIVNYYAVGHYALQYPAFPYLFTYANNVIRNNGMQSKAAGMVIYAFGGTHVLVNNLITANGGGGLVIELANPLGSLPPFQPSGFITNNTLVSNNASDLLGQGTELSLFGVTQTITNNLIVHIGTTSVPALWCGQGQYGLGGTPIITKETLDHNDFYAPNSPSLTPGQTGCVGTWTANRFEDPLFIDAAAHDFHLNAASPEIDVGNNAAPYLPATALDGNPRTEDGSGQGTAIVDIGAYEYSGPYYAAETLTSSLNPSTYGQPVTFTAQLSARAGTPTGSVQYAEAGVALLVAPVSTGGTAVFTTGGLSVGTHVITANYLPTGAFQADSAALTQVVAGFPTRTAFTCSSSTLYVGSVSLLRAMVTSSSGTPTGSIDFIDNGAILAQQTLDAAGAATYQYTARTAGPHSLTATYMPTGAFAGNTASCLIDVPLQPSMLDLTASPNPLKVDQTLALTAHVRAANPPAPTALAGTVSFFIDGQPAASPIAVRNGVAALALDNLNGGKHRITCTYSGDINYAGASCDAVDVVVNAAPTALTLTSSANPAPALSAVSFKLHLATAPQRAAGNLLTLDLTGPSGALLSRSLQTDANGNAVFTTSTLAPGSYLLTGSFAPTANLLASSTSLAETITALPSATTLLSTPNPAFSGQPVTIAASVSNTGGADPSAAVTFFDGSVAIGSVPVQAGRASFSTTSLAAGAHLLVARYPGDADLLPSNSAAVQQIVILSDYALSSDPGTLRVVTGHHITFSISTASLGAFSDQLQLGALNLPPHVTVILKQDKLTVEPGSQAPFTSVYLDTDDVIGYSSRTSSPTDRRGPEGTRAWAIFPFASLCLLGWRYRYVPIRRYRASLLLCLGLATGLGGLSACSGKYPASTMPGNYVIEIGSVGTHTRIAHTLKIPLLVIE